MTDKEKKREQVRVQGKEADQVIRIVDPEGRVPTPEELAKAICMAAEKKVGVRRK